MPLDAVEIHNLRAGGEADLAVLARPVFVEALVDEPRARPLVIEYILNNVGIWTGVVVLFLLAKYEDKINFGDGPGHHH